MRIGLYAFSKTVIFGAALSLVVTGCATTQQSADEGEGNAAVSEEGAVPEEAVPPKGKKGKKKGGKKGERKGEKKGKAKGAAKKKKPS